MEECFYLVNRKVEGWETITERLEMGVGKYLTAFTWQSWILGWLHRGYAIEKCDIYYKCVWKNKCFIQKNPSLGRKQYSLT